MDINEAIKIMAGEDQQNYKNLNLIEEYSYLCENGSESFRQGFIKQAKSLRKQKLKKLKEICQKSSS